MPRAELGSTKHISNQMKSKGLQRLRWYCQACSRQMRDENGFKCHVASESHVRNMMVIGEDPRKAINDYSLQFQSDFLKLLRTGHGEKKINVNHFYQEYIGNKEHVHMNATRWASLTEFAKFLGREGICRVEEEEADANGRGGGLMMRWIDNSPDALRRQDALRKKERQDRGDEEREWKGIREQIARAKKSEPGDDGDGAKDEEEAQAGVLQRKEGEKIKLSFGMKKIAPTAEQGAGTAEKKEDTHASTKAIEEPDSNPPLTDPTLPGAVIIPTKLSLKPASTTTTTTPKKHHNPLLHTAKKPKPQPKPSITPSSSVPPSKPISEAERIMREEIEQKQQQRERYGRGGGGAGGGGGGGGGAKRQRLNY